MIVAHVGPPPATTGGPAGYLAQLGAAFDGSPGRVRVLLPPPHGQPPTRRPAAPSAWHRVRRRAARLLGAPRYYRTPVTELRRPGGPAGVQLADAMAAVASANAPSLAQGLDAGADVLFAHDLAGAEAALAARGRGQQVWLMLHSPMPFGLYLIWSWAVPEVPWEEILGFPDVRAWVDREVEACDRVDRVILPCPEAVDELVRCDARFGALRDGATFLLTGARRPTGSGSVGASRGRWGLPDDEPVGLFLGSDQPYRGLDCLLEALEGFDAAGAAPGCVALAGPEPSRIPAHRRVHALGRVDDVGGLLASVDFVINVNRFSLFDLSNIEALEAGRPLFLHDTGGNRALARLGAGCELVPDLDPATVRDGLSRMFAHAPAERAALGARARACYDAHLTLAHLRGRHEALYASAGAGAPS